MNLRRSLAQLLVRTAHFVNQTPSSAYEVGSTGRRLKLWQSNMFGPNAALGDIERLRQRSRDMVRNNAWIKHGVNSWVSNEIGVGIKPRSLAPDETFKKQANALWKRWTQVADADGVLDFYGLCALASRTRIEGGEIFLRFRQRQASDGFPVPMQLQLLEPEFCPISRNEMMANGRYIRAGIEFDGIGKRRAYWMYRSHPGDAFFALNSAAIVPVPADSIIHHYAPLRPGQVRGVPWTIQALIKAREFDEYDDAELTRKKTKAVYTGVLRRPPLDLENDPLFDPLTGEKIEKDDAGVPMNNVESGTMLTLLPGEEVTMFDGDMEGRGYADFCRQQLMAAAAGMDIPYEFLSGDMSKLNDRLLRAILNEFHRIVEQSQNHLVIPQICIPVWEQFIDMAVLSGALSAPGYETRRAEYVSADWRTDRWDYIHPLQDVQAEQMAVKSGFKSRSAVVAERGESAEDVDEQNSEDQKRAEGLGLKYDISAAPAPNAVAGDPQTSDTPPPAQQNGAAAP
jgi:lambda family phage portal protein